MPPSKHDRHGQRQCAAKQDARPLPAAEPARRAACCAGRAMTCTTAIISSGHHHAWHHARQKQGADRRARDQRINDHRDRGRDHGPQRGADATTTARSEAAAVFGFAQHLANGHQAGAGGIGDRAAAHAREDDADQNVHLRQAAAHAADQDAAEIKDAFADRPRVHDVGGKHEQRHRQQHVAVVQAIAHLLGHESQILTLDQQVG
jgi:hypothetical protein